MELLKAFSVFVIWVSLTVGIYCLLTYPMKPKFRKTKSGKIKGGATPAPHKLTEQGNDVSWGQDVSGAASSLVGIFILFFSMAASTYIFVRIIFALQSLGWLK